MRSIISGLAAALVMLSAQVASAQAPAGTSPDAVRAEVEGIVQRSGIVPTLEALAAASAPELERTLEQLTGTLNVLATRIAEDAELRASATRAAHGLVGVAQVVVVEQSNLLQDVLRAAAERLATLPAPETPQRDPR
jgi:hypothetical protein